jgi:hypothetical protein
VESSEAKGTLMYNIKMHVTKPVFGDEQRLHLIKMLVVFCFGSEELPYFKMGLIV